MDVEVGIEIDTAIGIGREETVGNGSILACPSGDIESGGCHYLFIDFDFHRHRDACQGIGIGKYVVEG